MTTGYAKWRKHETRLLGGALLYYAGLTLVLILGSATWRLMALGAGAVVWPMYAIGLSNFTMHQADVMAAMAHNANLAQRRDKDGS